MSRNPEPWLRGPIPGVDPVVMPVLFSFAQVREDLRYHLEGLSDRQIWTCFGKTSIGFHLKHMAGSVGRLTTYLKGQCLSPDQLAALQAENNPGLSLPELLNQVEASLSAAESFLRTLDPSTLDDPRAVGRQELPTTVIGLLVHLAEHTQRHLGQAITLAGVVRQSS